MSNDGQDNRQKECRQTDRQKERRKIRQKIIQKEKKAIKDGRK